jgi:hypothetical protein
MKRNHLVALGAIVLLVGGVVVASNMGFKLNKTLVGPTAAVSISGTQDIGLPFNQQTTLVKASDLRADIIGSGATGVSVARFNPVTDALQVYAGTSVADDFNLVPAEGYRVKVTLGSAYIIVGSHDPGLVVNLDGPGTNGSKSGTQLYAYPYHSTANTASALRQEILSQAGGGVVVSVARFRPVNDALQVYAGTSVADDFALAPGESYVIKTSADIAYVPSHY